MVTIQLKTALSKSYAPPRTAGKGINASLAKALILTVFVTFAAPMRAFNDRGKTDVLWHNQNTGENRLWTLEDILWFQKETPFSTVGHVPTASSTNWEVVGTGDFNRDGQTDILWRDAVSGQNSIWLMNGSELLSKTGSQFEIAPMAPGQVVVGLGDFDRDGDIDILWRDPKGGKLSVWLMHRAAFEGRIASILPDSDGDWVATTVGDFNNDGNADILWRQTKTGQLRIWFMKGVHLDREKLIEMPLPEARWRLVGTGHFNPVGNTDLVWRSTDGFNSVWLMQSDVVKRFLLLSPLPDKDFHFGGTGGYTNTMLLSAKVNAPDGNVVLRWMYGAPQPDIARKTPESSTWTNIARSYDRPQFTNDALTLGQRYEFLVGGNYLITSINGFAIENRGTVILAVEKSLAAPLEQELELLKSDLIGDGWTVVRTNIARHDDRSWEVNPPNIASLKSFITNAWAESPGEVKCVFLIGHTPMPYAGIHNPDGHAWRSLPSDSYYGDVDGVYTDSNPDYHANTLETRHDKRRGDGKWDQHQFPPNAAGIAGLELGVGRIDFANLPALKQSEIELTRQYLRKDHAYRHKKWTSAERVVVGSYFAALGLNHYVYDQGLKNGSRLFGFEPGRIVDGDPLYPESGALLGIVGGFGAPDHIEGSNFVFHTVADLADKSKEPRTPFCAFYGSFNVDIGYSNNLMRAFLAGPTYGLGAMWFNAVPVGYPTGGIPLSFESMALGDPVGAAIVKSLNDSQTHTNVHNTYVGWMGDPTLRFQILAPPSSPVVTKRKNVQLKWQGSGEPGVQYWVYRSNGNRDGPWMRLTRTPLVETTFTDRNPLSESSFYEIRAVKLIETGSGSYTNLSQGVFVFSH